MLRGSFFVILLGLAVLVLALRDIGWTGAAEQAVRSSEVPAGEPRGVPWTRHGAAAEAVGASAAGDRKGRVGESGEIKDRLNALQKYRALGYFIPLLASAGTSDLRAGARDTMSLLRSDDELFSRARTEGRGALSDSAVRRSMDFKALEAMSRSGGTGDTERRVSGPGKFQRAPIGAPPPKFSSRQGLLSFPLTGEHEPFSIAKSRPDTEAILHNGGLFVRAPQGEPIRSVFRGTVVFSEWFREYGRVMIIDHGEHYCSLIAHADQLFKGVSDAVETGEVIATVGKTGALKEPGLYFEIRHHGSPVDPLDWLKTDTTSQE